MPIEPLSHLLRTAIGILPASFRLRGLTALRSPSKPSPEAPPPLFDDPYEALHHQRGGKDAAFRCPLNQCVLFNGLSFAPEGWNPFSATLRAYRNGRSPCFEGSPLEAYYRAWQPRNALEAFVGIDDTSIPLSEQPSYLLLWPWMAQTIEEIDAWTRGWYHDEMARHGFSDIDVEKHGFKLHGPTHPRVGRIEFYRLRNVFDLIASQGYDRAEGDVGVHLIERGSEVRFLCRLGMHRMAAMQALGHETVPARFSRQPRVLNIKEVDY